MNLLKINLINDMNRLNYLKEKINTIVNDILLEEIDNRVDTDIEELYLEKCEENEKLKEWINQLAEFLFNEYYKMTYVDNEQFKERKMEIVRNICLGKD